MRALERSVRVMVVVAVACGRREPDRRSARPAQNQPADAAATNLSLRSVPLMTAPAAPSRCPWTWADDTALTLDAPPEGMPFELHAVCSAAQLSVVWRMGTSASMAARSMRPGAPWGATRHLADDVSTLGHPMAVATSVWVPWITPPGVLRSARVDDAVMRSADAIPGRNSRFRDAYVIHAQGDQALIASSYRDRTLDRALVHRVGVGSAPPAGASLDEGTVVATLQGPRPVVITSSHVPHTPGGPWVLRAHRLDAPVAMALAAPAAPGQFGVLPDGGDAAGEALPVGVGRFEFVPAVTSVSNALLFETVIGAERGAVRVAWFPAGRSPSMFTLPTAATGLGAALDAPGGAVTILYWDDRHALQRAEVAIGAMGAPERIGEPLESDHAVRAVTGRTRWITCDGELWRVEARPEGAQLRVLARRAACDAPGG